MTDKTLTPEIEPVEIELRNPLLAAGLAWVFPGAGHFYQGRWAKGALFTVCILGTYLFGLFIGHGKVVHTGGTSDLVRGTTLGRLVQRWPIIAQVGVGVPTVFAFVQQVRVNGGHEPFLGGWFAPPRSAMELQRQYGTSIYNGNTDELAYWNEKLNVRYDIGMLYTMVAGLLNVLAIYDAYGGPVIAEEKKDEDDENEAASKKKEA
jgi:hypothetical protein